jgi:zinc transporter ZupT
MSVRQALFYNLVSSVLSVVGMVVGVLIGNIGSASAWIFGLTAGIFVYISLVDMVTQTCSHAETPNKSIASRARF